MTVDALLIDFDGVIRHWTPEWQPDPAFGITRDEFYAIAFEPELLRRAVTGEITDEQWKEAIGRGVARVHGDAAVPALDAWAAQTAVIDTDVVDLVARVRARVRVALITNATTRLESALEEHGLTGAFDVVVNSSRVGFAKPDEEIFRIAAGMAGGPVERCVFVDDTVRNVEAASALGMTAFHYAGLEDLRERLRSLSVLT